jgi:hypothetical protein
MDRNPVDPPDIFGRTTVGTINFHDKFEFIHGPSLLSQNG